MKLRISTVAIIVLLFSQIILAQTPPDTSVNFSGSVRVRAEAWDWFETTAADGDYLFLGSLLRFSAAQRLPTLDWQLEAASPLLLGLPDDAIAPAPQGQLGLGASYYAANGHENNGSIFLKQAFVRFRNVGLAGNAIRLGRFEFAEGSELAPKDPTAAALKRDRIAQRLIGPFGFSHVGRSFDGAQFSRDTASYNVTAFAAVPTEGVFDVDAMGQVDDVRIGYLGYTHSMGAAADWRLFAIHYADDRGLVKVDNRPASLRAADRADIGITTLGAHYLRVFPVGPAKADVVLWGALQTGAWGRQDHEAFAIAAEGGVHPKAAWSPSIRFGLFHGSGDRDPLDCKHETFTQLLPTPRVYARMPFYNLMNNDDAFVQLILRPAQRWTVRSDLHALRLADRRDLWYSGGGPFQDETFGYAGRPSLGSDKLAIVLDVSADFAMSPKTSLGFYFARAAGGYVIDRIYPAGDTGHFAYVELTRRF
jgi:hypothetical protein